MSPPRPPRHTPPRPAGLARPAQARPVRPGKPSPGVLRELPALAQVDDPLTALSGEGTPEEVATAEVTAMQQAFRDRAKREGDRFELETDSEHWFAVNFETRAQKDAFLVAWLTALQLDTATEGDKYLDGRVLAKAIGIPLPEGGRSYNIGKVDKALQKLR